MVNSQTNGTHSFDEWLNLAVAHSSNPEALRKKLEEDEKKTKSIYDLALDSIQRYNDTVGHLNEEDGYDCPICKNRGFIMKVVPDETGYPYEVACDCKCMRIRRNAKRLKRSGLAEWVDSKTFDTFVASEDWQKNMKTKALAYSESPDGWLYVAGQSGAGKTHICTATCLRLIESGKSVKYMLWSEIIHKLESTRFDDGRREDYIDDIAKNDVIYIDDFLKCFDKAKHLFLAFEFINKMIIMKKMLIISSEMFYQEIAGIDEALGGRIAEKAKGHIIQIARDSGRNYRFK